VTFPALTQQCAPAHSEGVSTSPGSAVIPDVFSGPAPSDVVKPSSSNNAG